VKVVIPFNGIYLNGITIKFVDLTPIKQDTSNGPEYISKL
jgi:hypothetical protein